MTFNINNNEVIMIIIIITFHLPPFFAEAVGGRYQPISGEHGGTTVQVPREEQAHLPRPLPLQRVGSAHNTVQIGGRAHLPHRGREATVWRDDDGDDEEEDNSTL